MASKARKVIGEAVDHDGLVALLRQRKDALDLSDLVLDDLSGLTPGHSAKILTCVKRIGGLSLAPLLGALGLRMVLIEDPDAAKNISAHWERRRSDRASHDNGKVSRFAVDRARPVIMTELATKAAKARWAKASEADRRAAVELMKLGRDIKQISRASTAETA